MEPEQKRVRYLHLQGPKTPAEKVREEWDVTTDKPQQRRETCSCWAEEEVSHIAAVKTLFWNGSASFTSALSWLGQLGTALHALHLPQEFQELLCPQGSSWSRGRWHHPLLHPWYIVRPLSSFLLPFHTVLASGWQNEGANTAEEPSGQCTAAAHGVLSSLLSRHTHTLSWAAGMPQLLFQLWAQVSVQHLPAAQSSTLCPSPFAGHSLVPCDCSAWTH